MNILENKKAIIFDFDGTLADTLDMWDEVDKRLAFMIANNEMKKFLTEDNTWLQDISKFRTESLRRHNSSDMWSNYAQDLINRYWSKLSVEEVSTLRNEIAKQFMKESVMLKENTGKFIKYLKEQGYYLILATVSSKWCIDLYNENKNIKSELGIYDTFDLVLTNNEVKHKKPDPEVYLKSLELSGFNKDECLVFEDSLEGVEAASSANIDTICIYDKHSDHERDNINKLVKQSFNNYNEVLQNINYKNKILVK